jgi:hypothetical protein
MTPINDDKLLAVIGSATIQGPLLAHLDGDLAEVRLAAGARDKLIAAAAKLQARDRELRLKRSLTDHERDVHLSRAVVEFKARVTDGRHTLADIAQKIADRESSLRPALAPAPLTDTTTSADLALLEIVEAFDERRRSELLEAVEAGFQSAVRAAEALLRVGALATKIEAAFIGRAERALFEFRNSEALPAIRDARIALRGLERLVEALSDETSRVYGLVLQRTRDPESPTDDAGFATRVPGEITGSPPLPARV